MRIRYCCTVCRSVCNRYRRGLRRRPPWRGGRRAWRRARGRPAPPPLPTGRSRAWLRLPPTRREITGSSPSRRRRAPDGPSPRAARALTRSIAAWSISAVRESGPSAWPGQPSPGRLRSPPPPGGPNEPHPPRELRRGGASTCCGRPRRALHCSCSHPHAQARHWIRSASQRHAVPPAQRCRSGLPSYTLPPTLTRKQTPPRPAPSWPLRAGAA
eukprot:scaffold4345_cov92-Isochrysis_galbana.AAC.4